MSSYPNGLTTPPKVTDPYGMRWHPIYHDYRMHYGTDSVNHPAGKNYAPEAGLVVFAAYNGGGGFEVRIESGGGRQWRIKHHSSFLVSVGQWVSQGQAVGYTGTTGDSTGVHCHCELWINGNSTDPYAWVSQHLTSAAGGGGTPLKEGEKNMFWLRNNKTGQIRLFGNPSGNEPVSNPNELGLLNTLLDLVKSNSTVPVPPRDPGAVPGVNDDLWGIAIRFFGTNK